MADKKDKDKIWKEILQSIRVSVSPAIFSTWLTHTKLAKLKRINDRLTAEVACGSSFVKSTVETRYFGLLQDALIKTLGEPCDLSFTVKEFDRQKMVDADDTPLFGVEKNNEEEVMQKLIDAKIRPGFTFESFAVSSSNQMAWAAAEAVSQKPGLAYNPLFLWGGVGVGKTHLMNAVAHRILEKNIDSKVFFVTGEQFTNDIVEGIRNKTTQAFRAKYRRLQVLLIDDIQFIAGKDAVQDEFFHTFNAVTGVGGQIIMTSDQPPAAIAKLENRLQSRFEAGLIVDIAPPDFELRCAIIQIKARQKGMELPTEVVHLIAGNLDAARKIEGFLTLLLSSSKIKQKEINVDLTKSLLSRGETKKNGSTKRAVSTDEVIDKVCDYYSVGKRAILGKARARMVARPRQVLMYILRTELGLPLQEVGRIVGGRDHTTVIHAVDKITNLASNDVNIREDLLGIKNAL